MYRKSTTLSVGGSQEGVKKDFPEEVIFDGCHVGEGSQGGQCSN